MTQKEKPITRRKYLKYVGGAIAVGAVAAAGYGISQYTPSPPPPTTATATAATTAPATTAPAGVKTVTLCTDAGIHEFYWLYYKDQVAKECGVTLKTVGTPWGLTYPKIMDDFLTGAGAFDLVTVRPGVDGGDFFPYLLPLDPYIEEYGGIFDGVTWKDYQPCYQAMMERDGKIIAALYDHDTHQLYYRKDLFNDPTEMDNFEKEFGYQLHPPHTWPEYFDMTKFFYRKKGQKLAGQTLDADFYGSVEIMGSWSGHWWLFNRFNGMGFKFFDEDTMKADFAKEKYAAALQNLMDCAPYQPPEQVNFEYAENRTVYLKGRAAMDVQWPCVGKAADGPPEFSESIIQGKNGYALVPGWDQGDPTADQYEPHKNVVTHPCIPFNRMGGISKFSKNPDAAFQYMFHEFSAPRIEQMHLEYYGEMAANTGNDPGLNYELKDPVWTTIWPTSKDYMDNLKKSWACPAMPDMIIPAYTEYVTALEIQMNNAWLGLIDAKGALKGAAAEWDRITYRRDAQKQKEFWAKTVETYKKYFGKWPL